MITNFEVITAELTDQELKLIPVLIAGFEKHTKENPIKAPEIVRKMNEYAFNKGWACRMTEVRLRKCVNYLRTTGRLPLIATSDGYYCSNDPEVIRSQIKSLRQRGQSIIDCANGLSRFLPK